MDSKRLRQMIGSRGENDQICAIHSRNYQRIKKWELRDGFSQWLRELVCKLKTYISISRIHVSIQLGLTVCTCTLIWCRQRQAILGARRSASLAKLVSFTFSERLHFKGISQRRIEEGAPNQPLASVCECMAIYNLIHVHRYMYVHT